MRKASSLRSNDLGVDRFATDINYEDIAEIATHTEAVQTVANNIQAVIDAGSMVDQLASLTALQAAIDSLHDDKIVLSSLYNDKAILDSLYADKVTLDRLYAALDTIEGLYASKAAIDSLLADKVVLDDLYADKDKLESIYNDKIKLDSLYADKVTLDTVYNNLGSIVPVAEDMIKGKGTNTSEDSAILNALDNANTATAKAQEAAASKVDAANASGTAISARDEAVDAKDLAIAAKDTAELSKSSAADSAINAKASEDNTVAIANSVHSLTVAEGVVGSSVVYDSDNNILTVPKGKEIVAVEFQETTDSSGLAGKPGATDTYKITFNDSTSTTFPIVNGANGVDGVDGVSIASIEKTDGNGASGTVDTYTITMSDNTTSNFTVYNGVDGEGAGDMSKAVYDADEDGIVDNAAKVNNHTVESDVPVDAKFTNTTYSDAEIKTKYENNTDTNAFTDAEKTKLADTETSSQLNDRDTANRDRGNHTGTQLANTISDLTSRIKADETTTAISLNVNTLEYVDEDGVKTNIDLSKYLDDSTITISSGVLNAATGICTFTRSDDSTFDVDLSALLDDTNLVTSVNGKAGVVSLSTDDVSEGDNNLYYTDARVSAHPNVVANGAKVSNVTTDLSYDAANMKVVSSDGTDATLTVVDGTNNGLMLSSDKDKLDSIPSNADNTAENETSHADVVVDGDFAPGVNGFLVKTADGVYSVDSNKYLELTAVIDGGTF